MEILPSVTISVGFRYAICCAKYGIHAVFSSGSGSLLLGGLHFTVLAMYTMSLLNPERLNMSCNTCPDLPTKGSPAASSSAPGASPMSIMWGLVDPIPGTAFVRVVCSGHFWQWVIVFVSKSNVDVLCEVVIYVF